MGNTTESRDIPWWRALGEGVVIIGSILIAFSLDAWWDDSSRERDLKGQLAAVLDELRSTHEALGRVRNAHGLNVQLAEALRDKLTAVPEGETVVIADEDLGPLLPQVTADVTTGALEAFVAVGGIDIIDDPELRRELLEWPTRIEDLVDDEIYLRNFAAADLSTYLRENADIANAELLSRPLLLSRFGLVAPVDPNSLGTVTLRREQLLFNLLAARESGERSVKINIDDLLARAEQIIRGLESVD